MTHAGFCILSETKWIVGHQYGPSNLQTRPDGFRRVRSLRENNPDSMLELVGISDKIKQNLRTPQIEEARAAMENLEIGKKATLPEVYQMPGRIG